MRPFLIGLVLTAVSWYLSWHHDTVLSEYAFTPLWIGYILTVNGISKLLFHDSLMVRMKWNFLVLFMLSVPMWWFFEFFNGFTHNWEYILPHPIGEFEYAIRASVSFSIVIPAILSTGYLFILCLRTLEFKVNIPKMFFSDISLLASVIFGSIFLYSLILVPNITFALLWIAPLLILDPLARFLKAPSFVFEIQQGKARLLIGIASATFFTGIFWEFWNVYSHPKWVYDIRFFNFWHVFEMPLFGYLGYLPFGLCVFSYTAVALEILNKLGFSAPVRALHGIGGKRHP